jgi:type I restriction enzyme S subunit
MELKSSYKHTDAGITPEDWGDSRVGKEFDIQLGKMLDVEKNTGVLKPYLGNKAVQWGQIDIDDLPMIAMSRSDLDHFRLYAGDLLVCEGGEVGRAAIWEDQLDECYYQKALHRLRPLHCFSSHLMLAFLRYWTYHGLLADYVSQTSIAHLTKEKLAVIPLPVPSPEEQRAIAEALSDADALINSLDKLIAKKRDIKQAAMQQLLTGKTRLPGSSGELETKTLVEVIDCLDNLRIPLNEEQRLAMKGDYPYCGANGILVYVNDYVIDDDIILIAEDGGYFDEYAYRPVAYKMSGKCWVNNHAHILKAKEGINQDYIFYSLVHKNILEYLANGTRAKLNKSEMYKIKIEVPRTNEEQSVIATILSDMDAEIVALEQKRDKTRLLKQGMMQELLTGRIRLI